MFAQSLRASVSLFLFFSILLGIAYPAISTGLVKGLFPHGAEGSLIKSPDGKILGSKLIGQNFTDPKYFWGRLSATGPVPYNAAASSGSNLGSANPNLEKAVKDRIAALKAADPSNTKSFPVDLVTASGSGLDPEISLAAAVYQTARIARVRNIPESDVMRLVEKNTWKRQFGVFGEPRVNVLLLNLALDGKPVQN